MDMPTYLLIHHKVRDFMHWKKVYDSYLMKRIEIGLVEKYVFRNSDDSNEVMILYETRNPVRARAFFQSQELLEKMESSGILGTPGIYFLNSWSEAVARASGF